MKMHKNFLGFQYSGPQWAIFQKYCTFEKKILKKNYKHHHDFHEIRLLCDKNSKLHQSNAFNDAHWSKNKKNQEYKKKNFFSSHNMEFVA
jgi:hypothetical protein